MTSQIVKLSDITQIESGGTPSSSNPSYWNGDINWVTLVDVKNKYITSTKRKITASGLKNSSAKLLPKGTVLFSSRATIGEVSIANTELATNQGFKNFICDENKVIPEYLYFALKFEARKIANSASSTTFKEISKSKLSEYKISLHPIKEQKIIVKKLNGTDTIRQKRKQAINLLDDYLRSVFIDMFGDPVLNPMGWNKKAFSNVCLQMCGGGTPSKSNPSFYIGDIPWVTPKDMKKRYIENSMDHISETAIKQSSTKLIPANSVIMVIRSGILKNKLPVAINIVDITINQDMKAFLINDKMAYPHFVLFFFEIYAKNLLKRVRAVTADNIKFDDIKTIQMILPPIDLQRKFSYIASNTEKLKQKMLKQTQEMDFKFQALMQKAFN